MNKSRLKLVFLLGFLSMLFMVACEKWDFDRASYTEVITVGSLEVGFSSAFLLGDIQGIRSARIIETGFVVSSTANDAQSLRLDQSGNDLAVTPSTGDSIINVNRAFAARASDLKEATQYFFRAYVRLEANETAYGDIDSFRTSSLTISAPSTSKNDIGCSGEVAVTVNLAGISPSPNSTFGIVWSVEKIDPTLASGSQIETKEIDQAGNINLQLPIICNTNYFLRGFYKTEETERYGPVKAFSTATGGDWISAGNFPEDFNRNKCAYSYSIPGYGFAIVSNLTQTHSQLWKFDAVDLSWQLAAQPPLFFTQICDRNLETENAILFLEATRQWQYFLINDQWVASTRSPSTAGQIFPGFFSFQYNRINFWGTGRDPSTTMVNSAVWRQPIDGEITEQLPDFPGSARYLTTYFLLNKQGYVGLGQDENGQVYTDFWVLDFESRSWSSVADFPDEISSTMSFTRDSKAYILSGYDANGNPLPNFYQYDPEIDKWSRLADFGRGDGNADIGFSVDGVIYGGLGMSTNGEVRREIWRYVEEIE